MTSNIPFKGSSSLSIVNLGSLSSLTTPANTQNGETKQYTITVPLNNTGAKRTDKITIASQNFSTSLKKEFTLNQEAGTVYNPTPQGPDEVNTDFSIIEHGKGK